MSIREVRRLITGDCSKLQLLCRVKSSTTMAVQRSGNVGKPTAKVYLQVLGSATEDTTPSLFLFADSQRYLFNCGEGTQRLINEHKLKLSRLNHIFFTQLRWKYIGGLPGMAMTLRDSGKMSLTLHGPSNLSQFMNATRFFFYKDKMEFECVGFHGAKEEKYEDENLTIWPVVLQESPSRQATTHAGPGGPSTSSPTPTDENPPKRRRTDPLLSPVVCYVCQLASLPGKFLPQKAAQLGIPKGPLYGALHRGETVTLPDGTQVRPEEVIGAASPGPVVLIIDCPSIDLVTRLVEHEKFTQYQVNSRSEPLLLMVHMSPVNVFQCPEYQAWMERFGDSVQHLVINKSVCSRPFVFRCQTEIQSKLHSIDLDIFPLLFSTEASVVSTKCLPRKCIAAENFMMFHLRPTKMQGFDTSPVPERLLISEITEEARKLVQEGSASDGPSEQIELQTDVHGPSEVLNGKKDLQVSGEKSQFADFEVVFIGTGAALPSKYRNVSSTLLNISTKTSILLDCGEGTYGQLYRHYGNSIDSVMRSLACVFISHIHADHHLGLIRILLKSHKQRRALQAKPVLVIGPATIGEWLREYSWLFESIPYRFIESSTFLQSCSAIQDIEVLEELEMQQILTVPVQHCFQAYGLVLQHTSGWKLVYSGDTRPCEALVTAGFGATLLIHEATFEDDLGSEALEKMHSTTTEAINIGLQMDAKMIMLNHFSQRYPKVPVFSEKFTNRTGIAFDHMRVRLSGFHKIPGILQPLKILFAEEMTNTQEENVVQGEPQQRAGASD